MAAPAETQPNLSLQSRADKLMTRALEHLDEGRPKKALALAQKLYAIRYSGAFEIEAQALAQLGAKPDAIAVLRRGVAVAPASWLNANLLANYLSDEGEYEKAFAVYEQALRIAGADCALIEANYALALSRAGKPGEARARAHSLVEQDLADAEPEVREFIRSLAEDLNLKPSR